MNICRHLRLYLLIYIVNVAFYHVLAFQEFDRNYTGVVFDPFVKQNSTATVSPNAAKYTLEEVQMMLQVILKRFSRVTTIEAGLENGKYIRDLTYYGNNIQIHIAETAAKINHRHGNKSITIIQGIRTYENSYLDAEVRLAIHCAKKANTIYPETVEGFLFHYTLGKSTPDEAAQTLKYLKVLKSSSVGHLRVGVTMYCGHAMPKNEDDIKQSLTLREILNITDFVVCNIDFNDAAKQKGVVYFFDLISYWLIEYRKALSKIKVGLEVMGRIQWASEGVNPWENLSNMAAFWKTASQWASTHSFLIWFVEAFDVPSGGSLSDDANTGWWKLTDNSKSGEKEGYIEKVLEGKELNLTTNEVSTRFLQRDRNKDGATATGGNSPNVAIYIAGVGGVVLILLLVSSLIAVILRMKKLKQQQLSKGDIEEFLNGMSTETASGQADHNVTTAALTMAFDKSLEIPKDNLTIQNDELLGIGQFGCVFRGEVKSPTHESMTIAVKVARDDCTRSGLKGLLSEIKIMAYLGNHPNIVTLIGAYTAELCTGRVYIGMELCEGGSLQSYLRRPVDLGEGSPDYANLPQSISLLQMLQWSLEIASGMEYLGTKNVVHADLATRNVLLTEVKVVKISDFGLSRRMYNYTEYMKKEQEPLPWRWMAIESLKRCEFSNKSDVWSYGVTLWEIFTLGDTPYPGLSWTTGFVNLLISGMRMECPTYAPPETYDLMVECWKTKQDERPSFSKVEEVIRNIIDSSE